MFKSPQEFSLHIEQTALTENQTCTETLIQYCDEKGIEFEDIAKMISHLCLPSSRYVTGQSIHVSGGMFMPWIPNRSHAGFKKVKLISCQAAKLVVTN